MPKQSQKSFYASAGKWGGSQRGFRIPCEVRDTIFRQSWKVVQLKIDGKSVSINLTPSFWRKCHELRSPAIRDWLKSRNLFDWPKGYPPQVEIRHMGENKFELVRLL